VAKKQAAHKMCGRLRATYLEDVSNNFVQELQETASEEQFATSSEDGNNSFVQELQQKASEEQFATSLKESRDICGRKPDRQTDPGS
jgi:hypothetical protein